MSPHLGREAIGHGVVDAVCVPANAPFQQPHKLLRLVAEEGEQRTVPEERAAPVFLDDLPGMPPLRSTQSS